MIYETSQMIRQGLTRNARLEAFTFERLKYSGEPRHDGSWASLSVGILYPEIDKVQPH